MRTFSFLTACLATTLSLLGCAERPPDRSPVAGHEASALDQETARILGVLNAETRDALSRDYEGWREHCVHASYVQKTYMNMVDSSFSETRGWDRVDAFVRTYIEAHPDPEPLPSPLESADVRLYGEGAWVSYEQEDADQGRKRESRLMEKVDGEWRIAGMHTTIYGPAPRTP